MKRLTSAVVALSFAAFLPAAALAQTTAPKPADRPADRRAPADRGATMDKAKPERQAWTNTQGLHETGDIIGASVKNAEGKDVGKVDALLFDPKEGKISHAVVGLGGFLGVGQDKIVVAYSDLKLSGHEAGKKATITLDQSAMDKAPKYVKAADRERPPAASPATSPGTSSPGASGKEQRKY